MQIKMEVPSLHICHSHYASLPSVYPLHFLFLVITIFMSCLAPPSSACFFKCGDNVFLYPFGGVNSGCGYPALQLECDRDVNMALINICGYQYYLRYSPDLWLQKHVLHIFDKNMWNERCDPSFSNLTTEIWSSPQFHVTEEYRNITLWECPPHTIEEDLVSPLPCNQNWYINMTKDLSFINKCTSQVNFLVRGESLQTPVPEDFPHAGFQIECYPNETCVDCEINGGFCAYETNSKQIYCNCTGSTNPKCPSGVADSSTPKSARSIILGCSIGGAVLIAVFLVFISYVRRRKASSTRGLAGDFSHYQATDIEKGQKGYMVGPLRVFTYQELQQATNFFDEKNELGDGGFGAVYMGKLEDGRTVAVKRLYQENSRRFEQFINEVEILSSLCHPNLVRLYGCTSPESPILLLVYEYVPNGTLADHLHGSRRSLRGLPWESRLKIALQTAQALAYLHSIEPPIFHRDVKSNNILLDEYLGAKVADFGLSRLVPLNVSHITTAPQGTPGYVDPEYHQCFQLTEKSDVYSFGVVLVEIISSKVAVDTNRDRNEISLAKMAIEKIRRDVLDELVDPDLKIENNHEVKAMVAAVAELAIECLARERDFRPFMKEVVARLEQIQEMQQQRIESFKFTSISPTASPLSVPIMGSDRTGQYWVPLSL